MKSILHDWVTELGLRHQGVLLTAIRGCDGVQKHDPSKPIMRAIRAMVLVPFDQRELTEPKGFMYFEPSLFEDSIKSLSKSMDEYPMHFILHVIHALEVIGYCHPERWVRDHFEWAYRLLVEKVHFLPETRDLMNVRLTEDRVANGTVAG
jgi:hypothetical protein